MPGPAICSHPENPNIFLFRGEPTLLITSAEHYGAVINLDFEYFSYLEVLANHHLNYTRIYAGAYLEPEHYFVRDNPLGPAAGRQCLPWARSDQPGFPLGGNKFNLERWNSTYFARLKDFTAQAGLRDIVVEVCFFNAMYPDTWTSMPLYFENNIQGAGRCECKDFQTLADSQLVYYQDEYVRKITRELNEFDNIILEICDEPGLHGTHPVDYMRWLRHLAQTIQQAESDLPLKHILAQQICGVLGGEGDVSGDPEIQLLVSQYIGETDGAQFGGIQLLDSKYELRKPIELNETAYYPIWYEGDRLGACRVEAWEFMLGSGAGFNHLNSLFSTYNPSGLGTEIESVLQIYAQLKQFLYSFDFLKMHRDVDFLAQSLPGEVFARSISEPGRQYAAYFHHSIPNPLKYTVQPGNYQETFHLHLPPGCYLAEWIDPASLSCLENVKFNHSGGLYPLATPQYSIDLALRLKSLPELPSTVDRFL
jgi:hypothetical protein